MISQLRIGGLATRALVAVCVSAAAVHAQTPPATLTIADAIAAAAREHPGPAEAAASASAAAEAVHVSRAAYLPRLDAVWQVNRASRNNVFGLLLPQSVVPGISGPVLGTDSFESAWGTAAGLLFSAEVFDFGRRAAAVDTARAQAAGAEAQADEARLEAGVRAADAFLNALAADRLVAASRANVARLETLLRTVGALVDADVRPGADRSRVDAELAVARNRTLLDEQGLALARVRLAAAIGNPDATLGLDVGRLLQQQPGGLGAADADSADHPSVRAAARAADAAEARLDSAERAYRPTVLLQGALSARASGALVNGDIDNGQGLWPEVPNWAAGVSVSFPILDFGASRARVRAQRFEVTAADARSRAAAQRARQAVLEARVFADTATRIAGNTPAQLAAARQTHAQARARYDAGLTSITEVADAERLLAQADADAALATLALWRARLALAAATGDLAAFVAETAAPTGPPAVQ